MDEDGLRPKFGRTRGGVGGIGGVSRSTYPPFYPSTGSSSLGDSFSHAIDDLFSCESDGCQPLYNQINRFVNQLQRRFRQYRQDLGNLGERGANSRAGHREKIWNVQTKLRKLLSTAESKGCLKYRKDAWHWATRPIAY